MSSERLIKYIKKSNLINVKKLIEECHIDPNEQDIDGYYPLLVAIYHNRVKIVKYLISLDNIKLNICDGKCMGVLHNAVIADDLSIVQLLLSEGINIDVVDIKNRTPLTIALKHNYCDIADELLNHNVTVRLIDIEFAIRHQYPFKSFLNLLDRLETPLNQNVIIKLLRCVILHNMDDKRYFPYLFERYCTFPEIISDLIGYQDKYRRKIIMYAAYCHINTLKILLQHGANPNEIDGDGETPLYVVVDGYDENPEYLDNIQLLLEYGADPYYKKDGKTILEIAKEDNKPKVVEVIENYLDFPDVKGAEED